MTDWQHSPTANASGGEILAGALCLLGAGTGFAILRPRWDEGTGWLLGAVALLGLILLIHGIAGRRTRSGSDRGSGD